MGTSAKFLLTGESVSTASGDVIGKCRKVATIQSSGSGLSAFIISGATILNRTYALAVASITKNASSGVSGYLSRIVGENIRLFYKVTSNTCNIYASFDYSYGRISVLPLNRTSCTFAYGDLEDVSSDFVEIQST